MESNEHIRLDSTTDSPEDVQRALELVGDDSPREPEQADTVPVDDSQEAPATPPDALAQQESEEPQSEPPAKPTRAEKRIQQLLSERSQRDTRIAALEGELKALREPVAPPPAQEHAPARPDRDQYYSDEEYMDALTDWKLDQRMATFSEEQERRDAARRAEEAATAARQAQQAAWAKSVTLAREQHADFDAVLASDPMIPANVAEALQAQERGGELLYHLVQQPDVLPQLAMLTPVQIAFELGGMSARLPQQENGAIAPAAPTQPRRAAPAPPTPVASQTSGQSSQNPDEMSYQDFVAWRKRGGARGR